MVFKLVKKKLSKKESKNDCQNNIDEFFLDLSHNLKNCLAAIRTGIGNISYHLKAVDKPSVEAERTINDINIKINHANIYLDMSRLALSESNTMLPSETEFFSIKDCLLLAIENYPFSSRHHAALVKIKSHAIDFLVNANKYLITYVFYFLIYNALCAFYNLGKIDVEIVLEPGGNYNKLHFRFSEYSVAKQNSLFSLGLPECPENGLRLIAKIMKQMKGEVSFAKKTDFFHITLLFPAK